MKKKTRAIILMLLGLMLISGSYIYVNYFVIELQDLKIKNGTNVNAAILNADDFLEDLESDYPKLIPYLTQVKPRSYAIPGLVRAKNIHASGKKKGKIGYANDMTPQGLTITEKYVIISAYSKKKHFHSVLWILDKETREFVKTVVLAGTDHVGGLAYDKKHQRLWITSVEKNGSTSMIASLELADILSYDFDKTKSYLAYRHKYDLKGVKRSSFMTLHDNKLFVGFFSIKKRTVTLVITI